jgi:hypothetical protein
MKTGNKYEEEKVSLSVITEVTNQMLRVAVTAFGAAASNGRPCLV